jgi:gag-polypeptide of LTR copia-type
LIVACLHASLLIASDTTPSSLRIAARFNRFTVCLSLPTSLVSTLSFAHLSLAPLIVVIMTSAASSSSTASSAGSLLSIEKLTADNFLSWKQRVQALLMREKAWDVIRKPTPVFTESKEDIAARAAWEDKDSLALADITLTLSTSQLGYTRHCKTAREAWSKLTAVHEKKTAASMLYL